MKEKIKDLFAEVVKMLVGLGYVSLDVQYIDETKIEAGSNRYTFVWRGSVEKYKEKLETKISRILSDIENVYTPITRSLTVMNCLKKSIPKNSKKNYPS